MNVGQVESISAGTVTTLATAVVWHAEQTRLLQDFGERVDLQAGNLQDDINQDLQVLNDLTVAEQSGANLERSDFQRYVFQVMALHPELLGLSWVPRVLDVDRTSFEQQQQLQTGLPFQISEQDASGSLGPAGRRADYFPVTYVAADNLAQASLVGLRLATPRVASSSCARCAA